jgi:hypothetical protein
MGILLMGWFLVLVLVLVIELRPGADCEGEDSDEED